VDFFGLFYASEDASFSPEMCSNFLRLLMCFSHALCWWLTLAPSEAAVLIAQSEPAVREAALLFFLVPG